MAVNLYKSITGDIQVATTECYLDGIELSHTANTSMLVYDEAAATKTAACLVSTTRVTTYNRENSIVFPNGGIKCSGIYVDYDAGTGTIYYHY